MGRGENPCSKFKTKLVAVPVTFTALAVLAFKTAV